MVDYVESLDKLQKAMDEQTKIVKKKITEYIRSVKSQESLEVVTSFLEQGRPDLALEFINDKSDIIFVPLLSVFMAGVSFETNSFTSSFSEDSELRRITPKFDFTNYSTVLNYTNAMNKFKKDFIESNNRLFTYAFNNYRGVISDFKQLAKYLISLTGLNHKYLIALENYKQQLGKLQSSVLDRTLRDERKDEMIEERIEEEKPFTEIQENNIVESYQRNLVESRTEFLALFAAGMFFELGRNELAEQINRLLLNQPYQIIEEWRSRRDDKVRYTHRHGNLDGQKIIQGGTFLSPSGARLKYPRDVNAPLSETAGCRCVLLRYVAPKVDILSTI